MDKASPHYKLERVIKYLEDNRDSLITLYLSNASPDFMVNMEDIWNIAKRDSFILKYNQPFADLKNKISMYFRTKRFPFNMMNYLLRGAI